MSPLSTSSSPLLSVYDKDSTSTHCREMNDAFLITTATMKLSSKICFWSWYFSRRWLLQFDKKYKEHLVFLTPRDCHIRVRYPVIACGIVRAVTDVPRWRNSRYIAFRWYVKNVRFPGYSYCLEGPIVRDICIRNWSINGRLFSTKSLSMRCFPEGLPHSTTF